MWTWKLIDLKLLIEKLLIKIDLIKKLCLKKKINKNNWSKMIDQKWLIYNNWLKNDWSKMNDQTWIIKIDWSKNYVQNFFKGLIKNDWSKKIDQKTWKKNGDVYLNDVNVQVWLRVKLGLALAAAVVPALGGDVGLVVSLVDLELLPLEVELAAAVDLWKEMGQMSFGQVIKKLLMEKLLMENYWRKND